MPSSTSTQSRGCAALLALSVAAIGIALLSSFRLDWGDFGTAVQVNFDRIVLGVVVGMSFASSEAALFNGRSDFRVHIFGFTAVSLASSMLLLGVYWQWYSVFTLLAGVSVGVLVAWLLHQSLPVSSKLNLWSAALLAISFIVTIGNFLIATAMLDHTSTLVIWLQGGLFVENRFGLLTFFTAAALFAWLLVAQVKETPAYLLMGLGIGLAGPVFFVGCLVPWLVRRMGGEPTEKLFLLTCAALGAAFIVLADAVPRMMIGGYAPSLMVAVSAISIPLVLYCHRTILLRDYPSRTRGNIEAGLIGLWLFVLVFLLWHAAKFAAEAA